MAFLKKKTVLGAIVLIGGLYLSLGLSVDNSLTDEDLIAINSLNIDLVCSSSERSYKTEIRCIKAIQGAVQLIEDRTCASRLDVIEPKQYLERNYGCCFDRARFIEKTARFYGFQTRHVFLIKPIFSSFANVLPLGQESHATSEILTSKGWIGVDSNKPFILVDEYGNPHTYRSSIERSNMAVLMKPEDFYAGDVDVIYGLYSRHGMFHGVKLPGPEYVFSELLYNL